MNQELDDRIEAYLDGLLSGEQAAAFERELTRPEVATAFSETLALRGLLAEAPPEQPPAGLIEQIEQALGVAPGATGAPRRPERSGEQRLPRARAALRGLGWSLRGPALALANAAPTTAARDSAAAAGQGLRTVRYALGPLQRGRAEAEKPPQPNKPKSRRAGARAVRYAYSRLRRDEDKAAAERPSLWRRLLGGKA